MLTTIKWLTWHSTLLKQPKTENTAIEQKAGKLLMKQCPVILG